MIRSRARSAVSPRSILALAAAGCLAAVAPAAPALAAGSDPAPPSSVASDHVVEWGPAHCTPGRDGASLDYTLRGTDTVAARMQALTDLPARVAAASGVDEALVGSILPTLPVRVKVNVRVGVYGAFTSDAAALDAPTLVADFRAQNPAVTVPLQGLAAPATPGSVEFWISSAPGGAATPLRSLPGGLDVPLAEKIPVGSLVVSGDQVLAAFTAGQPLDAISESTLAQGLEVALDAETAQQLADALGVDVATYEQVAQAANTVLLGGRGVSGGMTGAQSQIGTPMISQADFVPTATLRHQFASADGTALPAEVLALLPADRADLTAAQLGASAPGAPSSTVVADPTGTWTFSGWNAVSGPRFDPSSASNCIAADVLGVWTFAPAPASTASATATARPTATAQPTAPTTTPTADAPMAPTSAPEQGAQGLASTGGDPLPGILAALAVLVAGAAFTALRRAARP